MDHHAVAAVSIAGTGLDVLGSLYLAYDLLGGQEGPRAAAYSGGDLLHRIRHGIRYRPGPFSGLAAGLATGITVAIELNRQARHHDHYALPWEALFSAIRDLGSPPASTASLG